VKLLIVSKLRVKEDPDKTVTRYLESSERNPPAGIKRLARWFSVSFDTSYVVVECADFAAVSAWLRKWGEYATHEITPVMDDADLARSLTPGG